MADPFKFNQDFPAVDVDAISKFTRSFIHIDWVDGESLVQAQETPTEEGFNARFHKIEKDLDALGNDVKQAFSDINQMRSSLFALLNEIQVEFNRLREVTAEPPNLEAVRIILSKKNDLVRGGFTATGVSTAPGGPASTSQRLAACLRDLELYLNIVLESLKREDISIIDDSILGVKETALALGFSLSWIVNFYQYIKANHGLTGSAANVANIYFDRAISGLS
ncbi:hypothetical protein C7B80_12930 [Cyanosarcina cf. burmensis CCALA 770]|nr:hypothetical protein C7B80_12930 [Cyanosarcina cf. burmensis CCALA 770]